MEYYKFSNKKEVSMDLSVLLKDNIIILDKVDSWEEAIHIVAQPLINQQKITTEYIPAVIENIYKNGTYMVLFDYFAIPHARPEEGSLELGLSFLTLNTPILLLDKEVKYFLLLSTGDNDSHIELMRTLGVMLGDDELILEQLSQANSKEDFLNIFKKGV